MRIDGGRAMNERMAKRMSEQMVIKKLVSWVSKIEKEQRNETNLKFKKQAKHSSAHTADSLVLLFFVTEALFTAKNRFAI